MLPTLNLTGDVLLAERVSHRLGKVGPGDVVLVRSPVDPRKSLTKRVVAMGGDKVTYAVDPRNSDRVRTIVVRYCKLFLFASSFGRSNLKLVIYLFDSP